MNNSEVQKILQDAGAEGSVISAKIGKFMHCPLSWESFFRGSMFQGDYSRVCKQN